MLDVAGLPVMRQWYAMRRLDMELLPPAQALLEFFTARMASVIYPRRGEAIEQMRRAAGDK